MRTTAFPLCCLLLLATPGQSPARSPAAAQPGPWGRLMESVRDLGRVLAGPARSADRVDLRDRQSPVKDQGAYNSCVAHAVLAAMEAASPEPLDLSEEHAIDLMDEAGRDLPRRRPREAGDGNTFTEASLALTAQGVVAEKAWPYREDDALMAAPRVPLDAAATVRIGACRTIPREALTVAAVEAELAAGREVALAIQQAWDLDRAGRSGSIELEDGRDPYDKHAVLVVGCDGDRKAFLVKNSMGRGWGLDGYARMSYAYFERYRVEGLVVDSVQLDAAAGRAQPGD